MEKVIEGVQTAERTDPESVKQVHVVQGAVPVAMQRQTPTIESSHTAEVPHSQHPDRVADVAVVFQRRGPPVQTSQETVDVPQTRHLDRVVDVHVVMRQQMRMNHQVRRSV